MRIAIINGNLQGLFLSHMLLDYFDSKIDITIFDKRIEIGFPVSGSGLLKNHLQWIELLDSWILHPTILPNLVKNIGLVYHRGWLEKDVSLSFVSRGGQIKVCTITHFSSSTSLLLQGAGGKETSWQGDLIIDCSSANDSSLIGAMTLTPQISGWKRSDNIWEAWYISDSNDIPENVIEIVSSISKDFECNTIDYALEQSKKLFKMVLKGNDKE